MRRLLGLLLILRAFAPIIAVIVVLWVGSRLVDSLQAAVDDPIRQIEAEAAAISARFETAQAEFEALVEDISTLVGRLQAFNVPDLLPDLPSHIMFPQIPFPDPSVPVPTVTVVWSTVSFDVQEWVPQDCGPLDFLCDAAELVLTTITKTITYPSSISIGTRNVTLTVPDIPSFAVPLPPLFNDIANGLEGLFSGFKNLFNVFDAAFNSISSLISRLQALPESLSGVATQVQDLVNTLKTLSIKWGGLAAVTGIILLVLLVVSYGVTFIDDLSRGWRMVFAAESA